MSYPPSSSVLADRAQEINSVFGADTLATVLKNLARLEHDWALSAAKKIEYSSPLSLQLAFDLVREARTAPGIVKALSREYRFVSRAMESGDILEGIRAALIDRDRKPSWKYPSISEIPQELINQFKDDAPGGNPDFKPLRGR